MKNVDELYEKHYNAYKNDYDADELTEAKKKKFDYKQLELFDKTDKKLMLYEETKKFIKEIKTQEKNVDKKGLTKYFSYKPTTLMTKLLGQNTQDLRKSLDKIKEQKIKLNEDKRSSTDNQNKNGKLVRIYHFFSINFCLGEQSDELNLPKWININKKRFNEILSTVTKAKNEGLRTNVDGREIKLNNTESLVKDLGNGLVDNHEFTNRYNDIVYDVEAIVNKASITRSQKTVKIWSLLKEISKFTKSDEQPDTIHMPELESEESAAERRNIEGKGL